MKEQEIEQELEQKEETEAEAPQPEVTETETEAKETAEPSVEEQLPNFKILPKGVPSMPIQYRNRTNSREGRLATLWWRKGGTRIPRNYRLTRLALQNLTKAESAGRNSRGH